MRPIIIGFLILCMVHCSFSQSNEDVIEKAEQQILQLMKEAGIPGLSVVIISGNRQIIRSYGYSDIKNNIHVTPLTLFQLGSCSKAFTALAIAGLVRENKLSLAADVSEFIPSFNVYYKDRPARITLGQLLHHTSGIPWETISRIPQASGPKALQQTVKVLEGQPLSHLPGTKYEYATINYDVLALVVEKVTRQPFEQYVQRAVIDKLKLSSTTIGFPIDSVLLSKGYKNGFFRPVEYKAPIFGGNNAAGYVISNATDIAAWLKVQLGMDSLKSMPALINATHQRDETVSPHGMAFYAMGWEVSINGNGEFFHAGLNPNYTAYLAFRPGKKTGVAILANSNSSYTPVIGSRVMQIISGDEIVAVPDPGDGSDKAFSLISFFAAGYIACVIAFLAVVIVGIGKKKRKFSGISLDKFRKLAVLTVALAPVIYGLYLIPEVIADFTWASIVVWMPISFIAAITLVLFGIAVTYIAYLVSLCFPEKNKFKSIAPRLVLLSIITGLANMMLILLITSSLGSSTELKYLVFYYCLALSVYLLGRRYVQINLIKFSRGLTFELRTRLIEKIMSTSYQKFEKIDPGRVYAALNDDVNTIGESSNMFVMIITSVFTIMGAFIYLASVAVWATVLTVILIVTLSTLYYFVSKSNNKYFEQARDTVNVFMRLTKGMIDGFKEISLNRNKKLQYKSDIEESARQYKEKISTANIRFTNAFMVGESLLIVLLGIVSFAMPTWFPSIQVHTLMSFIIVLLYLIGPINGVLGSVPSIMTFKIAWRRIQQFLKEIPANQNLFEALPPVSQHVYSLKTRGVTFKYKNNLDKHCFEVGPIDLEVRSGEILFIVGGNGSGKTTLAKLITGLYKPDEGVVLVNDEIVSAAQLSEHYSAVFSPPHLFDKLYNVGAEKPMEEINKYLKILDLHEKVEINENKYSTINLSGGQRKRLALLQCFLEDSPIYLFDEWAADQDPSYRQFFYRTLLPEIKKLGKIVIAITHDDHYFDVADKVLKMNQGKPEIYSNGYSLAEIDRPVGVV